MGAPGRKDKCRWNKTQSGTSEEKEGSSWKKDFHPISNVCSFGNIAGGYGWVQCLQWRNGVSREILESLSYPIHIGL